MVPLGPSSITIKFQEGNEVQSATVDLGEALKKAEQDKINPDELGFFPIQVPTIFLNNKNLRVYVKKDGDRGYFWHLSLLKKVKRRDKIITLNGRPVSILGGAGIFSKVAVTPIYKAGGKKAAQG